MNLKQMVMAGGLCALTFSVCGSTLKNGESVAFLGDSITQQGWGSNGYVRLCESAFKANGLEVTIVPAGISGHKSNNMLARLEKDVLSKKPTYMTLSCGVNDVWHGANGVPLDQYKENITKIVNDAQAAGVKVIILTSTMIGEDVENDNNKKLANYNVFLRDLAKEKNCILVDLSAEMQKKVAAWREATGIKNRNYLTRDGVHMAFPGNCMMAQKILEDGFAFTKDEIAKTKDVWNKANVSIRLPEICVSGEKYLELIERATSEKKTVDNYVVEKFKPAIKEFEKSL